MKCIVTAGPTYEELDQVRRLTNFSTGVLGSQLADFLTQQGHEVELLRGYYSIARSETVRRVQIFTTTADLRERLRALASPGFDAVFHAAAVSDFTFGKIWRRLDSGELVEIHTGKISTRDESVLAELKPTLKVIRELRGWFPSAWIAGWKYEVDGDRSSVLSLARQQIAENRTDACIVNGRAYGDGYGMVSKDGGCEHLMDKGTLCSVLEKAARQT